MKLHQIALAAAIVAAGSASAATVTFTVSGATALNKSFEKTALDMCNTSLASATYSTAGVSDVEPKLVSTSAADYANLNNAGIVAQVFGMAVSDNVYRQLQAAQGLADVNATTFDPAFAPSLPASFVRGARAVSAAQ